jgi:hypothetical protein
MVAGAGGTRKRGLLGYRRMGLGGRPSSVAGMLRIANDLRLTQPLGGRGRPPSPITGPPVTPPATAIPPRSDVSRSAPRALDLVPRR